MLYQVPDHGFYLHKIRIIINLIHHFLIDNILQRHSDYTDKAPQSPAGFYCKALILGKACI